MDELTRDEQDARALLESGLLTQRTRPDEVRSMVEAAVRGGRLRKAVRAGSAMVALTAVVGATAFILPGLAPSTSTTTTGGSLSPSASTLPTVSATPDTPAPSSPTAAPDPSASGGSASATTSTTAAACTTTALHASLSTTGSMASQPYSVVALKNTGPAPCALNGYPTVTFITAAGARIATVVTNGPLFEVPDPGATDVVLGAGDSAWFAIGTGTANGGPVTNLPYAMVSWGSQSPLKVKVDLAGNAAKARDPIPAGVTAFALGTKPAI